MRAILYFNDEKVKESEYPRLDMQPIENLESGYEWQVIEQLEPPIYDNSIDYLVATETKTAIADTTYPHLNKTVRSYDVVAYTVEQLQSRLIAKNEESKQLLVQQKTEAKIIEEAQLSDDTVSLDNQVLFPMWKFPFDYTLNSKCQYFDVNNELVLYKCVQAHTSQVAWQPKDVPALFTRVAYPNQILDFVQPTGAQDAYQTGNQVYFPAGSGIVYESLIDANVWSPTGYPVGWKLI